MNADNLKIYTGNIVCGVEKNERLVEQAAIVVKDEQIVAKGDVGQILEQYSYS